MTPMCRIIPDSFYGERVKTWLVVKPGRTIDSIEIAKWCKDQLVHFKAPTEIEMVNAIPRTTVGKVLRCELVLKHIKQRKIKQDADGFLRLVNLC